MSMTRRLAGLAAVLLLGAACGGGGSEGGSGGNSDGGATSTTGEAAAFAEGTTMAALVERGELVVGTKFDQRGFGIREAATGEFDGFDIEIARIIAAALFGGTPEEAGEKVKFVEAVSKNREPFLSEGTVDIVVATYTINDERKKLVDFAGPYFVARQDIMVKADNTDVKGVEDLNGKKVCTAQGSTSLKNLEAKAPDADTSIIFDAYSKCAEALSDGRVEAVTTDDTILAGFVSDSDGDFKLVGAPFSDEPYGIGLPKGDEAMRDFLNDVLEESYQDGSWANAFKSTLGEIGLETPDPPTVNRY